MLFSEGLVMKHSKPFYNPVINNSYLKTKQNYIKWSANSVKFVIHSIHVSPFSNNVFCLHCFF